VGIPTLNGAVKYQIPKGIHNDAQFRLKGYGVPVLNGNGKGDLWVRVRVEVDPQRPKKKQKES